MRLRTLLMSACLAGAALVMVSVQPATAGDEMLKGETLYQDVVTYASRSPHRTGTPGDLGTSEWIAGELKKAGFETQLQTWKVRQFLNPVSTLKIGADEVDCFPFWYPKATGAQPVAAPLVLLSKTAADEELRGRIVFVPAKIVGAAVYYEGINPVAERCAKAGAVGLAAVVGSLSGELAAINANEPYHQKPLPLPAVIVAMKDQERIEKAAQEGRTASLLITGQDNAEAKAENVAGTLKRGKRWIVVTTPTSGWFTCAGERGPGVALFLALARWAAQSGSTLSYLFLSNSGHELDNMGAHFTLDAYAPPSKDVACWIHLGASIATREWQKTDQGLKPLPDVNKNLSLAGTEDLMPLLKPAFQNVPGYAPRSQGPIAGELRHFVSAGYRVFGFFGGHAYFHTMMDTPATTNPALLEPVGRALVEVIRQVEAQEN